jgi:hypothetical protein
MSRNVQQFRGGLVLKAHIPCASLNSIGLRVIKKKKKFGMSRSTARFR